MEAKPAVMPVVVRPWTRCVVCKHVWHLTDPETKPRDCPECGTMLWAGSRWRKTAVPQQKGMPEGTVWLCCARCGYQWFVRTGVLPVRCANRPCSSPYWHRPRRVRKEEAA